MKPIPVSIILGFLGKSFSFFVFVALLMLSVIAKSYLLIVGLSVVCSFLLLLISLNLISLFLEAIRITIESQIEKLPEIKDDK